MLFLSLDEFFFKGSFILGVADTVKFISLKELPDNFTGQIIFIRLKMAVFLYNSEGCGLRCTESN